MKTIPTLAEFASIYKLDILEPDEVVELVTSLLQSDVNSPSLGVIAGEIKPVESELKFRMKLALSELNLELPETDEAMFHCLKYFARGIVNAEIDPYEGARKIWLSVIYNRVGEASDLLASFGTAAFEISELSKNPSAGQLEKLKNEIIKTSHEVLKLTDRSQLFKS